MCAIAPRLRGPRAADRSLRGEPGVVERWRVPGVFYILLHGGEPRSEAFRGRRQCFVALRVSCGIYVSSRPARARGETRSLLVLRPPRFLSGTRVPLSRRLPLPLRRTRRAQRGSSRPATLSAPPFRISFTVQCTLSLYTDTDHCTVHTVHHCGSRTLNNEGQPIFSQCDGGSCRTFAPGRLPCGEKR